MKIPQNLIATDFHKTPVGGADTKKAFHTAGKAFLRSLAKEVGNAETCEISSCLGGPGVLGEATLHSDKLYINVFESDAQAGVRVLYRTCRGRKDHSGGTNRYVNMSELAESQQRRDQFIEECKRIEQGLITS